MSRQISKILIANRGEIASRIIRTCNTLGIESVAIFSDADKESPFVKAANHAVHIGGSHVTQSYLNSDAILQAASTHDVDAIHPGYGLLSENTSFAQKIIDSGRLFIGPTPKVIELMGDKERARRFAASVGVPIVPGSDHPIRSDDDAIQFAEQFSYPILVKASAGGGGIGMQIATNEKKLRKAIATCRRRAASSFGNDSIYLEKYIEGARHIEVQIVADHHGNLIHLFERECSVQRRHQKVIEEAPSSFVNKHPHLREALSDAALKLASAAGYTNAGTVEFIVTPSGEFYFIEMNTRLQVEHPATEMVTNLDLVKLQIEITSGKPIPFTQDSVPLSGHAIECRIYAENPEKSFFPSPGHITTYIEPSGEGIRVDSGVTSNYDVTPFYDPLIAKLVVRGSDRKEARLRTIDAIDHFKIDGLINNLSMHRSILTSDEFIRGEVHTTWLETFTSQS